jgi:type II secretory ATPase GspE/PulE/Tfp pilus assembly ATPase PilB-like protein
MNTHTLGYLTDPMIVSRVRDSGKVFIDSEGQIGTTDLHAVELDEISDLLRISKEAFDGRYYGRIPTVRLVDPSTVQDHLRELNENVTSAALARNLDTTDAATYLKGLLEKALERNASDIHLINVIGTRTEINFRVDGKLINDTSQSPDYGVQLCTYAAYNLGDVSEYSITGPAEATFNINLHEWVVENGIRVKRERETSWRFDQIPVTKGSKVTIRNLSSGYGKVPKLNELGLEKGHEEIVKGIIDGQGAILVTGPTGSGKTTLINSILQYVPTSRMIHTLEDPPEWQMSRSNEVQTKIDEQFIDPDGNASKSFFEYSVRLLRHDTNVVYFGEVRQQKTAMQFMRMSETGQLCVGTLHTNSSVSAISTLVQQMNVSENQLSAPAVVKALAHCRLVRTLCKNPECRYTFEEATHAIDNGLKDEVLSKKVNIIRKLQETQDLDVSKLAFVKEGNTACPHCKGSGEKGRTGVFEIIVIDDTAREFIRDLDIGAWLRHLKKIGWPSIRDHAISKVARGLVDVYSVMEEVEGIVPIDSQDMYKNILQ